MPVARALLDTGVLVAALHRDDRHFKPSVAALDRFQVFFATEAVLTEAMYLLGGIPGGPSACLDFFTRGGAVLVPATCESLARCRGLIEKYGDLPMDFADATLVALAEQTQAGLIFTLDRKDFSAYRFSNNRSFTVRP